jgi:hypothetical protein
MLHATSMQYTHQVTPLICDLKKPADGARQGQDVEAGRRVNWSGECRWIRGMYVIAVVK